MSRIPGVMPIYGSHDGGAGGGSGDDDVIIYKSWSRSRRTFLIGIPLFILLFVWWRRRAHAGAGAWASCASHLPLFITTAPSHRHTHAK